MNHGPVTFALHLDIMSVDDKYFLEYADPRTHKSMVLDEQRVLAYKAAIEQANMRDKGIPDSSRLLDCRRLCYIITSRTIYNQSHL